MPTVSRPKLHLLMSNSRELWERLRDPDLSPSVAARVVSQGSREEQHYIAANRHLPQDILLKIIDTLDWEIVSILLLNYDLPTDLLLRVESRHAEHVPSDMIRNHPSAPLYYKLELRSGDLTGAQLSRFFEVVHASPAERQEVHLAIERDPEAQLGALWASIR